MKAITSMPHSLFIDAPLSFSASQGESRQPRRRQPRALNVPTLSTDALAASKPEVVCGGILGLCLFYTLCHVFMQMVS